MKKRLIPLFMLLLSLFIPLKGDGIIIPPPGINLSIKYQHVTVTIDNQLAHTEIDQIFLNASEQDSIEGIYIFPLPAGASFDNYTMFVNGEEIAARIYDADSARILYESILRQNEDPSLLEYLGRDIFQARIFPINSNEDKRITISYSELLKYEGDIYKYVYSLSTEKFSYLPLDSVSVLINLTTSFPLKNIYSPSHAITIQKIDDYRATVTYSAANVKPDLDFVLYYTVNNDDIGMNVLTHRSLGEDGFFLYLAAPKYEIDEAEIAAKRIVFVIDRSGSMVGEKIRQAKEALAFCINSLNDKDYFNIVDFSSEITQISKEMLTTGSENIKQALAYIETIEATGGTNINEALLTALNLMQEDNLTNMVVFLTDGEATVGVIDNTLIQNNVKEANSCHARIFAFGVGYDVNTHLLDNLTMDNGGVTTYVRPDENIEVAVSDFYSKINTPVLSDITVDYGAVAVYDCYPHKLPDLFKGSQIVQFGRYRDAGSTTITLSGTINNAVQAFLYDYEFAAENDANDFIARLWAVRKVGYLLDEIRLHGEDEEIIDEIIALSKRYGIITPYTSFLIFEDQPAEDNWDGIGDQTGQVAFENARNNNAYRNAQNGSDVSSQQVKYLGNKTFFLRDSFWIDAEYEGDEAIEDIEFLSSRYFETIASNQEVAPYLAIGKNILVSLDNTAYKIHEKGKDISLQPPSEGVPADFYLFQNYPNPFNPQTLIEFSLPHRDWVRLSIFNVQGEKIIDLIDGSQEAGHHRIWWDGRNSYREKVASGIYFYRLTGTNFVQVKKMIVLR